MKRKIVIGEKMRKITDKQKISTKFGEVSLEKKGKTKSHLGKEFIVFEPTFADLYSAAKRGPQAVLLKDAALIAAYTGIGKNSKVVDAGTGSGWLASYLARVVAPAKVISYEVRDDFIKIAKENLKFLEVKNVQIKNKNVYNGIEEKNRDLVTLDLPEPWQVKNLKQALRIGGYVVAYLLQMTQVTEFVNFLEKESFFIERVIEINEREWEVRGRVARPKFQQLNHTAFLVFARRT